MLLSFSTLLTLIVIAFMLGMIVAFVIVVQAYGRAPKV